MKLLYSGSSGCDQPTLKRLMVIAEEISFMDRPSVMFENWGTIAYPSFFRRINSDGSPVKLSVFDPPSGPAEFLYKKYIEADIQNQDFVKTFLDGLKNSDSFAVKFIQLEGNYRSGTGAEVRFALTNDPELTDKPVDQNLELDVPLFYEIHKPEGRRETLKSLLAEASINVTSALLVSQQSDALPVTDDPYFAKLLSMRSSHPLYVGTSHKLTPFLGLEIIKAVIPDQALQQINIADILQYREKTKDAYEAWSAEVNRTASKIEQLNVQNMQDQVAKLIATEFAPQVVEYKKEMVAIRDNLFGNLLKNVAKWQVPSLSLAYFTGLGATGALTLFASAMSASVPNIVEYIQARRSTARKYASSYLIGLSND